MGDGRDGASQILILEDAGERVGRFRGVLGRVAGGMEVRVYGTAVEFVREMGALLGRTVLISLDHDLMVPGPDGGDPGDGLDVARALAQVKPVCPVIIHSSNADRVARMRGTLEVEGWECRIVLPFGADWVETYWRAVVEEVLARGRG
jgi:hypothetical protein